jgi:hypothetical protein
MDFANVHLREYLNSKMSGSEFTAALKNMCLLMEAYKEDMYRRAPRPESEQLNNTPMSQAIIATAEIMKTFKKVNNLDICSLVVIHDGDADGTNSYWIEQEVLNRDTGLMEKVKKQDTYWTGEKVFMMRDRQNKFEMKISSYTEDIPKNLLMWFQKVTGARVFGFFIVPNRETKYVVSNRYRYNEGKDYWQLESEIGREAADAVRKQIIKQFKSEKFLACKLPGYENFFFISGGEDLTTNDDDGIEVEGKFSARKLATAFAKYNKKRAVNRVLVSRFIQGIAA